MHDISDFAAQAFDRAMNAKRTLRVAVERHRACRIGLAKAEELKAQAEENIIEALMNGKPAKILNNIHRDCAECANMLRNELHNSRVEMYNVAKAVRREMDLYKALAFLEVAES